MLTEEARSREDTLILGALTPPLNLAASVLVRLRPTPITRVAGLKVHHETSVDGMINQDDDASAPAPAMKLNYPDCLPSKYCSLPELL